MSATIYFRPEPPKSGTPLDIGGPSSFLDALERAFGDQGGEWTLNRAEDMLVLRGLAAGLSGDQRQAVQTILRAVEEHGVVSVWAER